MQLFDREHHVPVLAPDDVPVLDGELFEELGLDIAIVLGVRVCQKKWPEVHRPGCAVAEEDVKAHFSRIFRTYDI